MGLRFCASSVEFRKGKAGRGLDFDTGTVSLEVQEAKSMTGEPGLGARLRSARGAIEARCLARTSAPQLLTMVDSRPLSHHHSPVAVILTTAVFDRWLERLRDRRAVARVQVRIDRAEMGNLGDCKPVGGGVSEMRIDYGPGYRVYFVQRGHELVILLAGGEKGSQGKDIEAAKALAKQV